MKRLAVHYGLSPKWVLMGEGPMLLAEAQALEGGLTRVVRQLEQEKSSLQADYIDIAKENRDLLKENAELKIELVKIKARTGSLEGREGPGRSKV